MNSLVGDHSFRHPWLGGVVALALATVFLHAWLATTARHELTQVEPAVAMHSFMLSRGEGLYHSLYRYPFAVSQYGPVFYGLSAGLMKLGFGPYPAGRLLSFASLLVLLCGVWLLLRTRGVSGWGAALGVSLTAICADLAHWGTVGQTDVMGLCLSILGFALTLQGIITSRNSYIWFAVPLFILGLFTKQSFVAAPVAALIVIARASWKRALVACGAMTIGGGAVVLLLQAQTGGNFFSNAFLANVNPFSTLKFRLQLMHFVVSMAPLMLMAAVGARSAWRERDPVLIYLLASASVMLATWAKVGAEVNYQLETSALLAVSATIALDRVGLLGRSSPGESLLLAEISLLIFCVMQPAASANWILSGWKSEMLRRGQFAALLPFLSDCRGRLLSGDVDALLHMGRSIDVDMYAYRLNVEAGLSPPEPVLGDLKDGSFCTVILYEDLNHRVAPEARPRDVDYATLPLPHLDAIRERYRMVRHLPGPTFRGQYIYQPR